MVNVNDKVKMIKDIDFFGTSTNYVGKKFRVKEIKGDMITVGCKLKDGTNVTISVDKNNFDKYFEKIEEITNSTNEVKTISKEEAESIKAQLAVMQENINKLLEKLG